MQDIVDTIVHQLTGQQLLWHLSIDGAVIFRCPAGRGDRLMNNLRVAITRERKARKLPRLFKVQHEVIATATVNIGDTGKQMSVDYVVVVISYNRRSDRLNRYLVEALKQEGQKNVE